MNGIGNQRHTSAYSASRNQLPQLGKSRTRVRNAERTRLKELQRKGVPVDITTATVKQYLEHWLLNVAKPEVRPTTYVTYELLVRLYIVPGLGKRKLRALQAEHIRTWLGRVAEQCQCCAQKKDAARAEKGKARCCARTPKDCCQQYPGTGTRRAIPRVLRATPSRTKRCRAVLLGK
jgi:hypothetical protein